MAELRPPPRPGRRRRPGRAAPRRRDRRGCRRRARRPAPPGHRHLPAGLAGRPVRRATRRPASPCSNGRWERGAEFVDVEDGSRRRLRCSRSAAGESCARITTSRVCRTTPKRACVACAQSGRGGREAGRHRPSTRRRRHAQTTGGAGAGRGRADRHGPGRRDVARCWPRASGPSGPTPATQVAPGQLSLGAHAR